MVVYSVEGVQNLPFKIKPTHFSILIPTPLKNPTTEQISRSERVDRVGFQDKQITDRQMTHTVRSKCWVCKLLYMPHWKLLQYKKVVMHLVTKKKNSLELPRNIYFCVDFTYEMRAILYISFNYTKSEKTGATSPIKQRWKLLSNNWKLNNQQILTSTNRQI